MSLTQAVRVTRKNKYMTEETFLIENTGILGIGNLGTCEYCCISVPDIKISTVDRLHMTLLVNTPYGRRRLGIYPWLITIIQFNSMTHLIRRSNQKIPY